MRLWEEQGKYYAYNYLFEASVPTPWFDGSWTVTYYFVDSYVICFILIVIPPFTLFPISSSEIKKKNMTPYLLSLQAEGT